MLAICLLFILLQNAKAINHDIPDFHFSEDLSLSDQLKRHLEAKGLPSSSKHIISETFLQNLDHFNDSDERTWKQHFLSNLHNDKGYGVNFLRIGGESALLETELLDDGFQMMVWAKYFGASAFALEHRFYGKSQPFQDLFQQNLQYLNVGQALADIAFFIEYINERRQLSEPKWVVFGGSYSGNLAAWFRQEYPQLTVGAVASSAPVQATLDFPGYLQVVEKAFQKYGSKECLSDIKQYLLQSQKLLLFNKSCGEELTQKDTQHFLHSILGSLVMPVQRDTPSHVRLKSGCLGIRKRVEEIQNNGQEQWKSIPNYCSAYQHYVKQHTNVQHSRHRAWQWQLCTEFGFCQTTSLMDNDSIFANISLPLSYYTDFCMDVFGKEMNESSMIASIRRTNQLYGGAKNFNASQVVFSNGDIDPWHQLSVYKRPNRHVKSIFIEGASHCVDTLWDTDEDSDVLMKARRKIKREISKWIKWRELSRTASK